MEATFSMVQKITASCTWIFTVVILNWLWYTGGLAWTSPAEINSRSRLDNVLSSKKKKKNTTSPRINPNLRMSPTQKYFLRKKLHPMQWVYRFCNFREYFYFYFLTDTFFLYFSKYLGSDIASKTINSNSSERRNVVLVIFWMLLKTRPSPRRPQPKICLGK